jgi:hypothetical protein
MRIREHGYRLLQTVNHDGRRNSVPKTVSDDIHFNRGGISLVVGKHYFVDGRRLFVIFSQ